MSNRTTINVDKETHSEASQVKDEHGETWPEVLQWYAENRDGDTDTNDTEPMQVVPVDEVVGREVPQSSVEQDTDALRHQLERNYEAIVEATNAAQSAERKLGEMRQ